MLKKLIFIFIFLMAFSVGVKAVDEPELSASSAVIINSETLEVFYEKDADTVRSMASTTKIMTALIACESGKLNCVVNAVDFEAEGTSIGLKKGDKLYLRDLVYGMMLQSGNDAARLTATFLAGSEEKFAVLMNNRAREIGMKNTNFVTASGLDAEGHQTTAYDMALLGAEAIQNEALKDIMSQKSYTADFINPDKSVTFYNHNKLLGVFDGVFGIKTGYTKKSGRCLVTACERDGVTFIAVTLRAPDDWNDHKKLYEYAYELLKFEDLDLTYGIEKLPVYSGKKAFASVSFETESFLLPYKEQVNYDIKVYLPRFIYAPVKKGDVVGKVAVYVNGRIIAQVNVYCKDNIQPIEVKESFSLIKFFRKLFDF